MQDYEQQLERLKQALNVESDTAFSQYLEMSQGSVSGAKKREQIPHAWFFQVAEISNISVDWLYWGEGPMRRRQDFENNQVESSEDPACVQSLEDELRKAMASERTAIIEAKEAYKMAAETSLENSVLKESIGELKAELAELKKVQLHTPGTECPLASAS